jgi:hypothetical protein
VPEQPAFDVEQETAAFAGEATQPAAGGDDAVAGHDDWIGIGAASLADSARGVFEVLGHIAVGVVWPVGMAEICSQTRRWKVVPAGRSGRPKAKPGSAM